MVRIQLAIQATLSVILLTSGLVVFCSTADAVVSERQDTFQRGVLYFDAGNYQGAYDLLLKAFKKDPGNLRINFYLGRAAFEIGNYEMALMAFERILFVQPESVRVKLEMARTYYRLGLRANARRYFEEVLAAKPPDAVRRNIEYFLADIQAAEKRHFFSGQMVMGLDWDDNVWVAPANDVVQTVIGDVVLQGNSAKPIKDWIFNTTGILNYTYQPPDSPYALASTGAFYQAYYRNESDLDTLFLTLNTGPEVHSDKYLLGLHGLVNYLQIDWQRYLQTAGAEILGSVLLGPYVLLNVIPKFEDKKFYQITGRDAQNYNLTVGSVFLFGANRIGLSAVGEMENARDDIYSYKQIGGIINWEHQLPYNFMIFGYYEYLYKAYEGNEVLFDQKRKDNIHYAGGGLSKILWQSADLGHSVSLRFSYRYTNSMSNIDLYAYHKNVVSASLAYSF